MKKLNIFALFTFFVFLSVPAAADTKNYDYKDFTEVNVGYGMNVTIKQGDSYSVKVNAEEKDLAKLIVELEGSSLNFSLERGNYRLNDDIEIYITAPELTAVGLSGGSKGNLSMKVDKDFEVNLSGGSGLEGELKCADVDINLSGGSKLELEGSGNNAHIGGSGGSRFDLREFQVKNVDVELSGGSQVKVKMNGTLNASQSGGSNIVYYGSAKIGKKSSSGGSEIRKGN